jgi:hypothetical protein
MHLAHTWRNAHRLPFAVRERAAIYSEGIRRRVRDRYPALISERLLIVSSRRGGQDAHSSVILELGVN